MNYCVCNYEKKQVAWCKQYSSAVMMAQLWGGGTCIIETQVGIHRDIVQSIRRSW